MDNLEKANIICEFVEANFNDDLYDDFFVYNDLGVPMAVALKGSLINLTDEGQRVFNETWSDLCEIFGADPNAEYSDLEDLIS
jgi:hypothetical protein